jgi:hypothetical protein
MFISRKKYEEALEAARKEGAEKEWEQFRMTEATNALHQRIDGILERLNRLEPKPIDPCQCNTCNCCSPLPY